MSIDLSSIWTLAGLLAGWGLTELSHRFRKSDQSRQAVGVLLYQLAEIRHRITCVHVLLPLLRDKMMLSEDQVNRLQQFISQLLPGPSDRVSETIEQSILVIAGHNPKLAFQLGALHQFEPFISRLKELVTAYEGDASDPDAVVQADNFLRNIGITALDEAIIDLAKQHSRKAKRDFNEQIAKWKDTDVFKKYVDESFERFASVH